jgi:TetR/AcrR family transcriptional repressor of nem operon
MPNTKRNDAKTEFLLEKGIEVLWSKGYNGTSVNDIVKAADVPKGSFYFYFNSKEDFAVKALDYYFDAHMVPAFEILNDSNVSPRQRILNLYEYRVSELKCKMGCKMGCMANNLGNEMSGHSELIRNTILEKENIFKQKLIDVVLEAQNGGEISKTFEASELVDFLESAGKGAMITMKERQDFLPVENVMKMVKHFL